MPSDRIIPLTPISVDFDSPEFAAIQGWPFADSFVSRLLEDDVPLRMQFNQCSVWAYRDPDGRFVGFGTLEVCAECGAFTGGKPHPYIPLLAVNPTIKSLGFGTSIVRHLIDEATLLAARARCHDRLFLDVYSNNERAIRLYERAGFTTVSPHPISDPEENGLAYLIMAMKVA